MSTAEATEDVDRQATQTSPKKSKPSERLDFRGIVSRNLQRLVSGCVFLLAGGSLVRWTVADRWPVVSTLYYATPPFILASLAAGLTFVSWRRKRKGWMRIAAAVACFWVIWAFWNEVRFSSPVANTQHRPVMLWNMRNGDSGWSGALNTIEALAPPIMAIVEGGGRSEEHRFTERFPNYAMSELRMGLAIMAKGKVEEVVHRPFENGRGKYLSALVESGGHAYRVLIIDLESNPLQYRKPGMQVVAELVKQHSHEPLLVVGDFNTPRDSVHFDLLREAGLQHAFEAAGSGYGNTWPYPLSVLHLDHFWFNDRVSISKCEHLGSINSDHKIVRVHCRPE